MAVSYKHLITGTAPEVTVKEDTLEYNSTAYRTPEGAMLEAVSYTHLDVYKRQEPYLAFFIQLYIPSFLWRMGLR